MGLFVEISVTYNNHTFQRRSDPTVNGIALNGYGATALGQTPVPVEYFPITSYSISNLNYEDVTTATIHVELAGGLCNRTLGNAIVNMQINTCPNYLYPLQIQTFQTPVVLPAHQMTVTFSKLQSGSVNFNLEVARYLTAVLNNTAQIDLRNTTVASAIAATVRFEYHPQPTLQVAILGTSTPACADPKATAPLVIQSLYVTNITVYVTEVFPGLPSCDYVTGNLTLTSFLGENLPNTNFFACYTGCNLALFADTQVHNGVTYYSKSRAQATVTVGYPVLFAPFTKNVDVRMSALGQPDATIVCCSKREKDMILLTTLPSCRKCLWW